MTHSLSRSAPQRRPGPQRLIGLLLIAALAAPASAQRATPPPEQEPAEQSDTDENHPLLSDESLDFEYSDIEVNSGAFKQLFGSFLAPHDRFTNSAIQRKAFRPVVAEARRATVEVRHGRERLAFGGIVGPDGWVVTKASLLRAPVTCYLRDEHQHGRLLPARVVGVDTETDLAMLKIDASGLPTLDLSAGSSAEATQVVTMQAEAPSADASTDAPQVADGAPAGDLHEGDWLATVGQSYSPIAVGVLSVQPRPIEKRRGFLGVTLDLEYATREKSPAGVRIQEVRAESAAEAAGLEDGDLIVSVDNRPTPTPQKLQGVIGDRHPGDRIELDILRGEEKLRLLAMLRGWDPNPAERRAYFQNTMGGELSERRFGFPSALQHDTVLEPDECGGPVVDLNGRVVAFNIARAGRTESYALPVAVVRERLLDLMSGRLAPVGLQQPAEASEEPAE